VMPVLELGSSDPYFFLSHLYYFLKRSKIKTCSDLFHIKIFCAFCRAQVSRILVFMKSGARILGFKSQLCHSLGIRP